MIAKTWGEFFTEWWNSEIWSWESFIGLFCILFIAILAIVMARQV